MIDLSRAPDHRWARIDQLTEEGKEPSRVFDNKHIRRGRNFLRRYNKHNSQGHARLEAEYPDLWSAFNLWTETLGPKWLIEAAILAGRSSEEIASYLSCSEDQIRTYERYFYDVRGGIKSKGWVVTRILMPAVARRLVSRDYDFLWKVLAYFGGWDVLDAFIEFKKLPSEVEIYLEEATRSKLIKDGFVAAHVREVNQYTSTEVIAQCIDLKRLELEQGHEGVQNKLTQGLEAVFGTMMTAMIPSNAKLDANEPRAMDLITSTTVPVPMPADKK